MCRRREDDRDECTVGQLGPIRLGGCGEPARVRPSGSTTRRHAIASAANSVRPVGEDRLVLSGWALLWRRLAFPLLRSTGMSELIQTRLWLFPRARRFTGSAARSVARKMRGRTGAVCDIRNPPLLARGVRVAVERWQVSFVDFADAPRRRVPLGTLRPFGVELRPGSHLISLLDGNGGLVWSRPFVVKRGAVTIATVFPPTEFLVSSRNVRHDPTLECSFIPPPDRS